MLFSNFTYREKEHKAIAAEMASAIKKIRGTQYRIGTPANLLYASSGGSDDYAAGVLGIPIVYTIELPPKDFELPDHLIRTINKETTAGLFALIRALKKRNV